MHVKERDERKTCPTTCPLRGYPVLLTPSGAPAKGYPYPSLEAPLPCGAPTGLILQALRCSAASNGLGVATHNTVYSAEHRSPERIRPVRGRQGSRPSSAGQGRPVGRAPNGTRSAGHPQGGILGCLFLSPISFGQAKEIGS
jgi:hypothetical protein